MKITKLYTFLAVLILGCAAVSVARTAPTKSDTKKPTATTKMSVHHMMGTVTSVSDSELVLEHKWKGKEEQTKFVLDSSTKKEGDIAKGSHVAVTYEMENHERKATGVKVSAMKSNAKTKSAASSKKS